MLGFATGGWAQDGTVIAWGDNRFGQTSFSLVPSTGAERMFIDSTAGGCQAVLSPAPVVPERRRRLEAIGFTWDRTPDEIWERLFAELCKWKKKDFAVPVTVQPLQSWRNHQRRMHRKGSLSPERRRQLKAIGFRLED